MEIHSRHYGRKNARALSSDDKDLYAALYPVLQFNGTGDVLEVGFGMGDFLIHQAMLHPHLQFIGVEPFKTGLIKLLKKIQQHNIQNIRVYHGVVHEILDTLPLLSAIYILYPDPWPKTRHHKRRLIQKEFLLKLRQHLKSEGKIYIASDHADYQQWIETVLQDTFDRTGASNEPFEHWISTKYERKARQEGRISQYYSISHE